MDHGYTAINDYLLIGQGKNNFIIAIILIASIFIVSRFRDRVNIFHKPLWLRWTIYYLLFIAILALGQFGESKNFIYFQF